MPGGKKLRLELIPGPLWGRNLRSNVVGLGPGRWLKLSRATRAALGKCAICGGTERLHGHENWEYVERPRSGVATLVGSTRSASFVTPCSTGSVFSSWLRSALCYRPMSAALSVILCGSTNASGSRSSGMSCALFEFGGRAARKNGKSIGASSTR